MKSQEEPPRSRRTNDETHWAQAKNTKKTKGRLTNQTIYWYNVYINIEFVDLNYTFVVEGGTKWRTWEAGTDPFCQTELQELRVQLKKKSY